MHRKMFSDVSCDIADAPRLESFLIRPVRGRVVLRTAIRRKHRYLETLKRPQDVGALYAKVGACPGAHGTCPGADDRKRVALL